MFVFQAEDGIVDLVRSRGRGDVYKRQTQADCPSAPRGMARGMLGLARFARAPHALQAAAATVIREVAAAGGTTPLGTGAVSYTPLTLPPSDLV